MATKPLPMRVSIILRSGKIVDFETNKLVIRQTTTKDGRDIVSELDYFRKDNGLSLMFVDKSEIAAIVRDTTKPYSEGDD